MPTPFSVHMEAFVVVGSRFSQQLKEYVNLKDFWVVNVVSLVFMVLAWKQLK